MSIEMGPTSVRPSVTFGAFPAEAEAELLRFALHGPTMGTRFAAVFFAKAGGDAGAIQMALQGAVDLVDQQMSTWKPRSDLSRLNATAPGQWVDVPEDLISVLKVGLDIGQMSGGAFDVGVGDLVTAWGFGPSGEHGRLAPVGKRGLIEIDADRGRVRKSGVVDIDLSGIAKGFGVDQLARCLDGLGIVDYLVSIDGEMRARGRKPDGAPWIVAVERPDRGARDVARVVELSNVAIATSGDYRHWRMHEGEMVSHTMDPRTGRPLVSNVASVTVVAEECMIADAWATALMVLGEIEGPLMAEALGLDALFVVRAGVGLREIAVGRLAED